VTDGEVLLRDFRITRVFDCLADPTKNRALAEFSDDVSPVFPYLNAVVPGLLYAPSANAVTARRGVCILTVYPHGAALAKVDGEEDAVAQLRWFQELCNDVWRRRQAIAPCYERRRRPGWLDIYWSLPRLNCGRCGETACMAFGCKLLLRQRLPDECPHLATPRYAEEKALIDDLLT